MGRRRQGDPLPEETATPNAMERRRWNDPYWSTTWIAREPMTTTVTPELLARLALTDGERVLDVGSGAGSTTIAAARAVAPNGSVIGADISAPLVGVATEAAARDGVDNVRFAVADVQTDPITGGPFDVAMSQFGVMFFEDPVVAFANVRSAVVPGGRLGFACWQPVERNPWFLASALASLLPPAPAPEPGRHPTGPFAFGDPAEVTSILTAAGWSSVEVEPVNAEADVERSAIVSDDQAAFLGVPESRLDEAREVTERMLDGFRVVGGRYRVPLAFFVVTAAAPT